MPARASIVTTFPSRTPTRCPLACCACKSLFNFGCVAARNFSGSRRRDCRRVCQRKALIVKVLSVDPRQRFSCIQRTFRILTAPWRGMLLPTESAEGLIAEAAPIHVPATPLDQQEGLDDGHELLDPLRKVRVPSPARHFPVMSPLCNSVHADKHGHCEFRRGRLRSRVARAPGRLPVGLSSSDFCLVCRCVAGISSQVAQAALCHLQSAALERVPVQERRGTLQSVVAALCVSRRFVLAHRLDRGEWIECGFLIRFTVVCLLSCGTPNIL
jgi:hypothetical protein